MVPVPVSGVVVAAAMALIVFGRLYAVVIFGRQCKPSYIFIYPFRKSRLYFSGIFGVFKGIFPLLECTMIVCFSVAVANFIRMSISRMYLLLKVVEWLHTFNKHTHIHIWKCCSDITVGCIL